MLVAQAKRSAELFTGAEIDDAEIPRIRHLMNREMQNIVLVGMPGCGKTTVAGLLGEKLGREVLDSDELVQKTSGMSAAEIIRRFGEDEFRRQESAAIAELGKKSGAVIATGGGCVTREENYPLLHQNGTIFWLQRDLERLPVSNRPLSQRSGLEELYNARRDKYARFADCVVDNNGSLDSTIAQIMEVLA